MPPKTKPATPASDDAPKGTEESLAAALLELQAKALGAKQSGTNPHFNKSYSTLEDAWNAVRDELGGLKILVRQRTKVTPEQTVLVTKVTHIPSGESEESETPVVWGDEKGRSIMQSLGSAITYARRYGLVTALGIIIEDDDANTAGSRSGGSSNGSAASSTPRVTQPTVPASEPQKKKIAFLLDTKQVSLEARQAIQKRIDDGTLNKGDASSTIDRLDKQPDKDKAAEAAEAAAQGEAEADAAAGAGEADAEAQAAAEQEQADHDQAREAEAASAGPEGGDDGLDDIPF